MNADPYAKPSVGAPIADNGGHWKGLDDLEIATCAWVSRVNDQFQRFLVRIRSCTHAAARGPAMNC